MGGMRMDDKVNDLNAEDNVQEGNYADIKNEVEQVSTTEKSFFNWKVIAIIVLAVVVVLLVVRSDDANSATGAVVGLNENAVPVEMYVMSQCPYGTQVEDAIKPVLDELKGNVNFNLEFIGNDQGGTLVSLHGDPEVRGDKVQLCAKKYNPDKYMDMIICMNKDARAIPGNWEGCSTGLDVEKIRTCYDGQEGDQLLRESFKKAEEKGVSGSPTIYINGNQYQGNRDGLSFKRAICQGSSIPECAAVPECVADYDCVPRSDKDAKCNQGKCEYVDPVKFKFYVINSKECTSCDTTQILQAIKGMFKGAEISDLDVSSDEAKKFVDELGLVYLPSYLAETKITESSVWSTNPNLAMAFEKNGEYYKLNDELTGATYFISAEKREEFFSSLGVKTGDNKPQIDFFVMSYCPYGNLAEEALYSVYSLLKGKVDFNPHYVFYSNYNTGYPNFCYDKENKYCSMHGIQELNQDVRELCVLKNYDLDKWFEFAKAMNAQCNAQNADICWQNVAVGIGIDVDKIGKCQENEAEGILKTELELDERFKARGSPSIYIDGMSYNGDRSSEGYKTALCDAFETKPNECNTQLQGNTAGAATAPMAGCAM